MTYVYITSLIVSFSVSIFALYRWAKLRGDLSELENEYAKLTGNLKKCVAQQAELSRLYKDKERYIRELEKKLVSNASSEQLSNLLGELFSEDSSEDSDGPVPSDGPSNKTVN